MSSVSHICTCICLRCCARASVLPPTPSPSSPPQTSSAANAAALTSRAVSGAKPGEEGRADKGDDENTARAPLPSASSPRSSNVRLNATRQYKRATQQNCVISVIHSPLCPIMVNPTAKERVYVACTPLHASSLGTLASATTSSDPLFSPSHLRLTPFVSSPIPCHGPGSHQRP